MKKVIAIIGARPQFIKHFAFESEVKDAFHLVTVHTGQHYDENMSKVFFDELGMKKPDYLLQSGGGNHGEQTGKMMIEIEKIVLDEKPDAVLVYGDTNSTLAGALVASKLHIPVFHIEAGLRSFNKEMPEEINRVLTDHVSDILFVPSQLAVDNLHKEGIQDNIRIVGDIMKDLVIKSVKSGWLKPVDNVSEPYYYATLHRPYNTDDKDRLVYVLNTLSALDKKVVFAIHPRTRNFMKAYSLNEDSYPNIRFIDPQGYFNNLSYLYYADGLITDSGGMQKEAYWLGKKCITIRKETEWTETLEDEDNVLMFYDLSELKDKIKTKAICKNNDLYGDGSTGSCIVRQINDYFLTKSK
jgi:UDP-GlcNAc3NAcA epimerase